MPQIWWCVQIFHLLILFFIHFSEWNAGVNIHVRATISMRLMSWDRGHEQLQQFNIHFFRWPLVVRYMQCVHILHLLCIVLHRFMFDDDEGSCLLHVFMIPAWCDAESCMWCTCFHDFSCYVLRSLCCYVDGILMLSPCMFALISLLWHVGGMLIMHEFVSYW